MLDINSVIGILLSPINFLDGNIRGVRMAPWKKRGVVWELMDVLENLNYADHIFLLPQKEG